MKRTISINLILFLSLGLLITACEDKKGGEEEEAGDGPVPEKLVLTDVSKAAHNAFVAFEDYSLKVPAPEGAEVSGDAMAVEVIGEGFELEVVIGVPNLEETMSGIDEGDIIEKKEKGALYKGMGTNVVYMSVGDPIGMTMVCRTRLGAEHSEAQARKVLEACEGVEVGKK